ncbi:MAG TPA: ABC transporter permease [Vicinamibacteria bacterium]|nr:ABC transporter permease [Vicinamibacteria bacterium]
MSGVAAGLPGPGRDVTRPVPFLRAAKGVFSLALEGMLWSRRSMLMVVLLGFPAVLAILFRVFLAARMPPNISGFDLYGLVVGMYYVGNILPLVALFFASALIADEVEGKTITYLLTRPVQRGAILLGKFVAYLATTTVLCLPAVVITFFLLATTRGLTAMSAHAPDLLRDLGVVVLTLLAYGALFALFGVVLRRPVIPGLLFLFVWELMSRLPGYLPRFTLSAYLRSLIRHRPAEEGLAGMLGEALPVALSLQSLAAIIVICLGLAAWIFSRREFVLEQ